MTGDASEGVSKIGKGINSIHFPWTRDTAAGLLQSAVQVTGGLFGAEEKNRVKGGDVASESEIKVPRDQDLHSYYFMKVLLDKIVNNRILSLAW